MGLPLPVSGRMGDRLDLLTRLQEVLESAVALSGASARLNREMTFSGVAEAVSACGSSLRGIVMGWVGLIGDDGSTVRPAASWGAESEYVRNIQVSADPGSPLGQGPSGLVIRSGQPVVMTMDDPRFLPWHDEAFRRGFRVSAAFPLKQPDGRCFGVLQLYSDRSEYFDDLHVALVSGFAEAASIAFENARLHERLRTHAEGLERAVAERTAELRETNEALAEATRMKSEFLANMSHELRSPLTAIIGFSEVLRDELFGPINPRQKEHIGHIWESGRRLLDLIEDILDLSRVEAGKARLDLAESYPRQIAEAVVVMVQQMAFTSGVTLDWQVETDADVPAMVDARKVKQILFHLLSASVRLAGSGGTVRLRALRTNGDILFTVWNSGQGLSGEEAARVFREFARIGEKTGSGRSPAGVGLALAKRLVEMHGGTIAFGMEDGGGASFRVTLPFRQAGTA